MRGCFWQGWAGLRKAIISRPKRGLLDQVRVYKVWFERGLLGRVVFNRALLGRVRAVLERGLLGRVSVCAVLLVLVFFVLVIV